MRIALINATCGVGSTGKICVAVSELLQNNGIDNRIFYSNYVSSYPFSKKYSNKYYKKLQSLYARIFGNWGFNSILASLNLVHQLKKYGPDIIHLHNIHSHDCNLTLLYKYIKRHKIKVFWTFHDCWSFTGYCTHFLSQNCTKWKTECNNCVQKNSFSWFFDNSSKNYRKKRKCYGDIDMTIITPSRWLANIVSESFLSKNKITVINNGINLSIFHPRTSNFREKYLIPSDDYIVLGVSFIWSNKKGLDIFNRLAEDLPSNYHIVLVGVNNKDKKKISKKIIQINHVSNQTELAEIYSSATIFVNPTREDTYPTVHLESIACGTPVICFDVGGCKEMLNDAIGKSVPVNDYDSMLETIWLSCTNNLFSRSECASFAKRFDEKISYNKYMELYLQNKEK